MSDSKQKIVQYLNEAHATEVALIRVLQSQIAMTPRSSYRTGLEKHLRETRDHARRVEKRLRELDAGRNRVQALTGAAEALLGQALALAKTPVDILRGNSGAEKVLKNARDASATEALEIATYTSIERLADSIGDTETARLAASIRADEEQMLERVLAEIPKLTDLVLGTEIEDVVSNGDVPIPRYDDLSANQIVSRLSKLSEPERRRVREYERAHKKRATVLKATERTPAGA
jgi:ferritin-like metal-binding protein YciE